MDFVIRAGSFNFSIGDISKIFLHHQDQQISQLPTAAVRSLLAGSSASTPSASSATSCLIHLRQRFIQSTGTRLKFSTETDPSNHVREAAEKISR
jgi:hypothetical protein